MPTNPAVQATLDLLNRYRRVFQASWKTRHQLAPVPRSALEREFLPAALELQDTPPSPLPRVLMWVLITAFAIALIWSFLGHVNTVASASGKIIPSTRAQVIQPIEGARFPVR